jgi:hypothetical protein
MAEQHPELGFPIFAIYVKTDGQVSCTGEACDSDCPIHGTNTDQE